MHVEIPGWPDHACRHRREFARGSHKRWAVGCRVLRRACNSSCRFFQPLRISVHLVFQPVRFAQCRVSNREPRVAIDCALQCIDRRIEIPRLVIPLNKSQCLQIRLVRCRHGAAAAGPQHFRRDRQRPSFSQVRRQPGFAVSRCLPQRLPSVGRPDLSQRLRIDQVHCQVNALPLALYAPFHNQRRAQFVQGRGRVFHFRRRTTLDGTTHSEFCPESRFENLLVKLSINPWAISSVAGLFPMLSNGSTAICRSSRRNPNRTQSVHCTGRIVRMPATIKIAATCRPRPPSCLNRSSRNRGWRRSERRNPVVSRSRSMPNSRTDWYRCCGSLSSALRITFSSPGKSRDSAFVAAQDRDSESNL